MKQPKEPIITMLVRECYEELVRLRAFFPNPIGADKERLEEREAEMKFWECHFKRRGMSIYSI